MKQDQQFSNCNSDGDHESTGDCNDECLCHAVAIPSIAGDVASCSIERTTIPLKNGFRIWLGDQKRREHERAERINTELQTAYADLRQTVGQLLQAERLSSLAEIASGVVHEVRNPLGAIKGAVEILEDEIPRDPPSSRVIAKGEIERIDKLVHEFLRFARPPKFPKAPANVNELVESVITLVDQRAAAGNVTIKRQRTSQLAPIEIDPEQIVQVLLNVAINTLDAMPNGGAVVFRTHKSEGAVTIEIEDTGVV